MLIAGKSLRKGGRTRLFLLKDQIVKYGFEGSTNFLFSVLT